MVKGIYGTVNGVGGNFGNSRRGGVKTKSAVKSGGVVISDLTVKPWGDRSTLGSFYLVQLTTNMSCGRN